MSDVGEGIHPMTSIECLIHMTKKAMVNRAAVSQSLGHNRAYINSLITSSNDLRISTLASLADKMGYTVQVVGHGETITLKPKE